VPLPPSPSIAGKLLCIRIISGQHLPKSEEQKLKGNVIEPYVKVRVNGHQCDEAEYVTKVVPKVKIETQILLFVVFLFLNDFFIRKNSEKK
jgi:hypothetical protein